MVKEVALLISYSDLPLYIYICVQSMSRLWSFHFQLRICIIHMNYLCFNQRFNFQFEVQPNVKLTQIELEKMCRLSSRRLSA